jgi:hypothetical protein
MGTAVTNLLNLEPQLLPISGLVPETWCVLNQKNKQSPRDSDRSLSVGQ